MKDLVKEHILNLYEKGLRDDGRKFDEFRKPIKVEYGISSKSAEGSAKVTIGETEVVAGVKMAVEKPFPDTPDKGNLMVNVELLPLSCPEFETGPPGIDSIELSRVVDRGIRESEMVDFEKLCIKEGESVWSVSIDIYPINNAGNLFDAAALAAIAALKDTKMPKLTKNGKVDYKEHGKSLPLQNIPIGCTVRRMGDKLVIDPNINEEGMFDSRLTVFTLENKEICAMQKGGEQGLTIDEIAKMVELAAKKGAELRSCLK